MANSAPQAREPYMPYRFTVDEYYRMVDADILSEGDRVELLDGQILVREPSGPEHSGHVALLTRFFVRILGDRAIVRPQDPTRIDNLNEPQPDLAIVRPREDMYMRAHPRAGDVLLVVEIAWSSGPGDRRIKAPLYARGGIPEFWLLDVKKQRLEVYRDPSESGYRSVQRLNRKAAVKPVSFPDLEIAVADILRTV